MLLAAALLVPSFPRLNAAEWSLSGSLGAHDPTVLNDNGTWWCFTTGAGLPAKRSGDGLAWTEAGSLFASELSWWRTWAPNMGQRDIWAPDLHVFGGRIWCYYSVSEFGKNNSAIGLKSCTSVAAGDWRDDGFVIGSKAGTDAYNAIDPNLTVDADGQPWLTFGSWFSGIQLVQLDPATMKPVGNVTNIAKRSNGIEGANVVYRSGYYYLFVSIDVCCQGVNSTYKIAYGRSRSISGPYVDKDGAPLLTGGGTVLEAGETRWKGPGGQDVFKNGNAWAIARHAYDANANGAPTLRIADLYWDANGWPTLTDPGPAAGAPTISIAPVSQTIAPGGQVTFSVTASGENLTYVWQRNGTPIAAGAGPTLTLNNLQASDSGNYTVTISNDAGQVTSSAAVLLVDTPTPGHIWNLSIRAVGGLDGDNTLIPGFIIGGTGKKSVLIRADGPTLAKAPFNVAGVLDDPKLVLHQGSPALDSNDTWTDSLRADAIRALGGDKLGGVALDPKEPVLLEDLSAGDYTVHMTSSVAGKTGVVLVELYDKDTAAPGTPEFEAGARLTNVSARAQVGTDANVLIVGFIINGNVPKRVLIRGTGPTLAQPPFNVAGTIADPVLTLRDASNTIVAQNDSWTLAANAADIRAAGWDKLGGVAVDPKDAVLMVTLIPGSYTAVLNGVNNTTGIVLIEVYEL